MAIKSSTTLPKGFGVVNTTVEKFLQQTRSMSNDKPIVVKVLLATMWIFSERSVEMRNVTSRFVW